MNDDSIPLFYLYTYIYWNNEIILNSCITKLILELTMYLQYTKPLRNLPTDYTKHIFQYFCKYNRQI